MSLNMLKSSLKFDSLRQALIAVRQGAKVRLLLAVACCLPLIACGSTQTDPDPSDTSPPVGGITFMDAEADLPNAEMGGPAKHVNLNVDSRVQVTGQARDAGGVKEVSIKGTMRSVCNRAGAEAAKITDYPIDDARRAEPSSGRATSHFPDSRYCMDC